MRYWAVLFLLCSGFSHADVLVKELSSDVANAYILNSITSSDYDALLEKTQGKRIVVFFLDSNGGSVDAALRIGRLLRKKSSMAIVERKANCLSSCIFILAGATHRAVDGVVGIHRPYELNDKEISPAVQKEKYKRLGKRIKEYLNQMNIAEALYDNMLRVPPESVKILTDLELSVYGLNQNDPFVDEANSAKQAQRFKISRFEYAKRQARATQECKMNTWSTDLLLEEQISRLDCQDRILKGN